MSFFLFCIKKNEDLKTHTFTGSCACECVLDIKYLLMYCCTSHQNDKLKKKKLTGGMNRAWTFCDL